MDKPYNQLNFIFFPSKNRKKLTFLVENGEYLKILTDSNEKVLIITDLECVNVSNEALEWYLPMPDAPTPPKGISGTI